jgi:hypothetical protein
MEHPGTHDSPFALEPIGYRSLCFQQLPQLTCVCEWEDTSLVVLRGSGIKQDSTILEIDLPPLKIQDLALTPAGQEEEQHQRTKRRGQAS